MRVPDESIEAESAAGGPGAGVGVVSREGASAVTFTTLARSHPHEPETPPATDVGSDAGPAGSRRVRRASRQRLYVPVAAKLAIALVVAFVWLSISAYLSLPWHDQLRSEVGGVSAWVVIGLLAFIPGFLVAFLATSALLDRQPLLKVRHPTTGVSILIAARNEAAGIADTIRRCAQTDYDGPVTIVLADNGLTDDTCAIAETVAAELGIRLEIIMRVSRERHTR